MERKTSGLDSAEIGGQKLTRSKLTPCSLCPTGELPGLFLTKRQEMGRVSDSCGGLRTPDSIRTPSAAGPQKSAVAPSPRVGTGPWPQLPVRTPHGHDGHDGHDGHGLNAHSLYSRPRNCRTTTWPTGNEEIV